MEELKLLHQTFDKEEEKSKIFLFNSQFKQVFGSFLASKLRNFVEILRKRAGAVFSKVG